MKKRGEARRPSPKKRFMRGAQVPDIEKHVAARRSQQMRRKADSRQSQRRIASFFKSVTGALLVTAFVLFLLSRLLIIDISADEPYLQTVEKYFGSSPTERIKPFFDRQKLEGTILSTHPEVGNVHINATLISNSVRIDIEQRIEALVWTDFSRAKSYILDSNGVVYREHKGPPRQDLVEIRDRSSIPVEIGSSLVAPSSIEFMLELETALSDNSLALAHFIPGEAPQDINVELNNRPYYLIFTTTRPLLEQIEQLDVFLDSSLGRGVSDYIDVRVADKVFYK